MLLYHAFVNIEVIAHPLFLMFSLYYLCGTELNRWYFYAGLVLHNSIMQHCNVSLNVILRGNESLSNEINIRIFESVHKFIENSNRF